MKFRNYCLVVMGSMEYVKDHIIKVAETKPRYVDAKGILIATFASAAEPTELKDFFKFEGRSFLLFDLDENNSSYELHNEKLNNHLFGYLVDHDDKLREMSNKIMEDISASTTDSIIREIIPKNTSIKVNTKPNYENLSKKEIEAMINDIIDKGVDKLTDSDKEILKKLSEISR